MRHPPTGFEASFEGTCKRCGEPIEVGQQTQMYGLGPTGWYEHTICPRMNEIVCSICGDMWVECDCP